MSTVVSDLLAKLITEIPLVTGYSGKKRISNPYELTDTTINSTRVLTNGWGLLLGGSNISLPSMKSVFADQTFTVILTKQISGSEESPTQMDGAISSLQTDIHELITHLSSNTVWAYTPGVIDVHINSTDQMNYFNDDRFRMIFTSATFTAKIEEDLD